MLTLTRIVLVVFTLLMGAVVLLTAIWNLKVSLGALHPTYAAVDDPALLNRNIRAKLAENDLVHSQIDKSAIRSAAQRDPLSDGVFVLAALDSREQGRYREALNILQIARKRDPRNRITRLLLADSYAREARAGEFVAEALALDQLRAGTTRPLIPILAEFAKSASTSVDTIEALRDSKLGEQVMANLARDTVSPELLLQFRYKPKKNGLVSEQDRSRIDGLVTPYLDANDWPAAQSLWLDFYGHPDVDLSEVTNHDFRGNLGPPFGWRLQQSNGIAELTSRGLELVHYGRSQWPVATQTLLLQPGSYRINFQAEPLNGAFPPLAWQVSCLKGGEILLDLPFERSGLFELPQRDTFVVPGQNCSAQRLTLTAKVDDDSEVRSARIGSVEIVENIAERAK